MVKKELKLDIKNTQIAQAINLGKLKEKLAAKSAEAKDEKDSPSQGEAVKRKAPITKAKAVPTSKDLSKEPEEGKDKADVPKRKARSRSVFAEPVSTEAKEDNIEPVEEIVPVSFVEEEVIEEVVLPPPAQEEVDLPISDPIPVKEKEPEPTPMTTITKPEFIPEMLGPTGRHIKDLLPPKPAPKKEEPAPSIQAADKKPKPKSETTPSSAEEIAKKGAKPARFKEFKDIKPSFKQQQTRFDGRDRQGLREGDDDAKWRKRRPSKHHAIIQEDTTIRPKTLSVRVPITIKDLAQEMKLKGSQLVGKLFLQGVILTINDLLEDETTIQLLGQEFGCAITIDTSEEERIQITGKSIKEEISEIDPSELITRAPVVAFMGHVDHGKTSLIDYIRKANVAQGEAGAITQHIGAFLCKTAVGDITILDTPGHEAFSAMRARGADVTDIVVLVVAGDEGLRAQTEEAINHAKAAGVTIVVAINKCDKPNFNAENVYRQLSEKELLPETWGGQTLTINCSATTGEGIKELLEMLALQAEILELRANTSTRARGSVLESEMHKGLGATATVLVQNGTLKLGDSLVFGESWGRVKTMRDEFGHQFTEAGPSTPVEITGLSGLPQAGEEFISVRNEKEAREIAEARMLGKRQLYLQQSRKKSLENILQKASDTQNKVLKTVLRADMQGSLEALKAALLKIESDKVDIEIISSGIGEISESDVLLAAASQAVIIGFHTQVESRADSLLKQYGVHIALHDIIYHAIDDVKALMTGLLDRLVQETDRGKAEVRAVFKSSHLGKIAGCMITEGSIHRNHQIRVMRNGKVLWTGGISSLKRLQDDVREVQKGLECGIVLSNFSEIEVGDILEAYEITYIAQAL